MMFIRSTILLAVTLACVSATLAQSSDWSGFYAGGNTGFSSDKSTANATLLINQITNLTVTGRGLVVVPGTTRPFAASQRTTNWAAGAQAGYAWRSGKAVFGFEGDIDPLRRTAAVSQSQQIPPTALAPVTTIATRRDARLNNDISLRGRIGWASGKTLIYGTAGYEMADVRVTSADSYTNPGGLAAQGVCGINNTPCQFNSGAEGPVVTTASETHRMNGLTFGGGLERMIAKRLSIAAEYRHASLGSKSFGLTHQTTVNTGPETHGDLVFQDGFGVTGLLGNVSTGPTAVKIQTDSVRVRFNFHF